MEPRIISREEHGISRKQISPNALYTLYRLHDNGFVAWLVGGCVRDLLLGRTPKDFDIVTDAAPGQIKRLFRNARIIGRRFRLVHLHFQEEILEISTFRALAPVDEVEGEESEQEQRPPQHLKDETGMVLRDNVFGTPEEDALRRDFTINALAWNSADFSVIDYTNGMTDLERRIIRPIGDPFVRFTEDPVRMIRAVRFAASHDFTIEPETWEAILRLAPTIVRAAPARLYEEVLKLFLLGSARPAFEGLLKSGLFAALFPAIGQDFFVDGDLQESLRANMDSIDRLRLRGFSPSPALLLAMLFGPGLEAKALARHRDGVPYLQALDAVSRGFLEDLAKTVSVPGRIGSQMRSILSLQTSLHRIPPRRPASLVGRPEFSDAMTYLIFMKNPREENRKSRQWWKNFISNPETLSDPALSQETSPSPVPLRRRKKKRRRSRPAVDAVLSSPVAP